MNTLVTYSAPNVRKTGPAAFTSLRSYYFRMYVCNYRQRMIEACESQDTNMRQLRAWFKQAGAIAKGNAFLSA